MITKRVLIELIQNRLAGGDVPSDVQGKYPYQVVSRLIGLVYADLAIRNKIEVRNMSLPYTLNSSTTTPPYLTLPVKPLNGMNGIIWMRGAEKGSVYYAAQGIEEAEIMAVINPSLKVFATRIIGNKLYFNAAPEATINIEILPDFNDLSDDDNVVVEGAMTELFSMVMGKMRENTSQLEEVYNNRVPDTDKPTQPAR